MSASFMALESIFLHNYPDQYILEKNLYFKFYT